jgi:MFS family permease
VDAIACEALEHDQLNVSSAPNLPPGGSGAVRGPSVQLSASVARSPGIGGIARGAWGTLAAALVAQTAVSVVEQGLPTLTAFIKQDLGVSAGVAGLVVAAFSVGKVVGSWRAGRAADEIGERTVLVVGCLGTGGLVALAMLLSLPALVVVIAVAGLFSATATPAGGKLVLASFPREQRGFALGLRQTGIPLGGLAAAALLPWLAHLWGWRISLAVGGAIAAAGALAVISIAGVDSRADRQRARAGAQRQTWRELIREREIVLLTVWGCLLVSGQYALIAFIPLDVHGRAHIGLARAGLLVAVAQVGGIVGRIGWGLASDRVLHGRRRPVLLAITISGVLVAVLLAILPGRVSFTVLALVAFAGGLSMIGWQGMWMTTITERAGAMRAGAVSGFGLTFIAIAITVTPPLYGFVDDLSGSFAVTWATLAAVLALALWPAALLVDEVDQRGS